MIIQTRQFAGKQSISSIATAKGLRMIVVITAAQATAQENTGSMDSSKAQP